MHWPTDDHPSPMLVAAWKKLGLMPTDRVPLWAAYWLADGYDGDALRTLAGLSGKDTHDVHDLVPDALADCGAPLPESDSAATRVLFTKFARMHMDGTVSAEWILNRVGEIFAWSRYDLEMTDHPLGETYDLACEWGQPWGRPVEELKAEIRQACVAQLAA